MPGANCAILVVMKRQQRPSRQGTRGIRRLVALAPAKRNVGVALCVLAASIADGFGIATLLPLIAVLGGGSSNESALARTLLKVMHEIGISANPGVMLGIVVGGTLLKAVLMMLALRQIGYAVADVTADLRVKLVTSVIGARWSYYVRQPAGRITNALSNEATNAGRAYLSAILMASQVLQALVYIGIAALLSWKLALFALVVSAVMLGALSRFVRAVSSNAKLQTELLRNILRRLSDVLLGIKPLKAMAREAHVIGLFARDLEDMRTAARREVFASNANRALQEPIIAVCLVIGIFAALSLLHMPLGDVLVMSLLLAKTVLVVGRSQQELNDVHSTEPGLTSVLQAIAESRQEAEPSAGSNAPCLNTRIEFDDVHFAYRHTRETLHAVNFHIDVGEIIVVTGPSGAGKTTFIDLLLGLHLPTQGEVRVDGVSLRELDRVKWRRCIGYAPQEVTLFHDTVAANITLGEASATPADIERALRDAESWPFVSELPQGIDTVIGERGGLLSGGQRQRLALARALVCQPRLLILDEATSALDAATEAAVIANLKRRVETDGLTILAISHHPAWTRAANRVLCMRAGRLSAATAAGSTSSVSG